MQSGSAFARVLFLCFLLWPLSARGDVPQLTADEKAIYQSSPGVVLVIVSYQLQVRVPGRELPPALSTFPSNSTGTGFLYRPDGYLVTNAHVVEEANMKDSEAQDNRKKYVHAQVLKALIDGLPKLGQPPLTKSEARGLDIESSTPKIKVVLANRSEYTGEIKVYSDPTGTNVGKDIAIVKIDGGNLPTVRLGDSNAVQTGDALTVIGYPGDASPFKLHMISVDSALVPTFTSGRVSAVKIDYKGTPVIQSDAAINHGNSGGPAFNAKGEVIGVATYGSTRASGINFFVPVNTAMEFIRQAGATPEVGAFDKTWATALDSYQAGNWSEAKSQLGDALALMPNLPDALKLQVTASQMARNETSTSRLTKSMGGLLWPAVGGLVAVVALAGFLMLRGRSAPAPAPVGAPAGFIPPVQAPAAIPLRETRVETMTALPPKAPATFGSLHVTVGSLKGNQFPIPKSGLLIGRDPAKCNIVLSDDAVSKEHAWVVPLDNGVVVIDRESSNGTYVNSTDGPSINKVALRHGDRLFIGKKGAAVLTFFNA